MREITVKFDGECRKCHADILAGAKAVYERRVGIFCLNCAPTETEEVREYRQEGADHKADKYSEWAHKRTQKANAVLEHNSRFTGDHAFNTQPGHIPLRARVIRQNDRAYESLEIAREFRAKAAGLRNVSVAGDKEQARQAKRDAIRPLLSKGVTVDTCLYGHGIVEKVNTKTATVRGGQSGTFRVNVDLSWLTIVKEG